MYKRVKIKKLGRKKTHRESLIRNQLRSLFTNGYVNTTTTKAKVLKANADGLLTKAKGDINDINLQRSLTTVLGKRDLVTALVEYTKKSGSVVKLMKVRYRDGDNAQISKVELVGYTPIKQKSKTKKRTKKTTVKKSEEVKKENKLKSKKEQPKSLGKRVKETFTGPKQRATSRSGLSG